MRRPRAALTTGCRNATIQQSRITRTNMEDASPSQRLFEHLIERFGASTFLDAVELLACERQLTSPSTELDEGFLRSVERALETSGPASIRPA